MWILVEWGNWYNVESNVIIDRQSKKDQSMGGFINNEFVPTTHICACKTHFTLSPTGTQEMMCTLKATSCF